MSTAPQTIADRVADFHVHAASQLPAPAWEVIGAEQAAQRARTPNALPTAGSPLPDGELLDAHGRPTTLSATRAGRPAVVVFYRGAWCPYCNIALRAYQEDLLPELEARGVALIAVSPQRADQALSAAEKNELAYPVLSDPGNQIAGALGILTETGAAAQAVQASFGIDVAQTNADGTAAIPMPTVVLVRPDGRIGWIDVHPDFTTRTEAADILKQVIDLI